MTGDRPYLAEIFDPLSVAVVGASNDSGKWGHQLARGALTGSLRRQVHFVNTSGRDVLGQRTYPSLAALPNQPELVVLTIPLTRFEETVDEALALGARAFLVVNSGFAESGPEGRARQHALADKLRSHGALLVGPNCMGVIDTATNLELAWTQAGDRPLIPGPVTVISQSGNVGIEIVLALRDRGVGLARFVAVGNQAVLSVVDFVRSAIEHEATRVIALYVEEFQRPRWLFAALAQAVAAGKRVVLIAPRGEAAARAAASHTGALTSGAAIVESVCRDAGVVVARTLGEAIDVAEVGAKVSRLGDGRAAVVSDGGGHAVLACDVLGDEGLDVPPFSSKLQSQLRDALSPTSFVVNPIDLAAASTRADAFGAAATLVAESGESDVLVITGGFGSIGESVPGVKAAEVESAQRLMRSANAAGLPVLVHTMFPVSEVTAVLRSGGAIVKTDLASGAHALSRVLMTDRDPRSPIEDEPGRPSVPATPFGYFHSRAALVAAGLTFPAAVEVSSVEEAVAAAADLRYPVALKATDLLHKSDAGGVALGLSTAEALRRAWGAMQASTHSRLYSVEQMVVAAGTTELIVGARYEPAFGPVVLVGAGGIAAEVHADIQLVLWPASRDKVRRSINDLSMGPILRGYRGSAARDVEAVIDAVIAVATVLCSSNSIKDVEVNPLMVGPAGAVALDARIVCGQPGFGLLESAVAHLSIER